MSLNKIRAIRIPGKAHEVDSFAACIQAAVTHWGGRVSYECVAGLSGAAFSPVWSKREPCVSWWMERGNNERMEFLGHTLGFTVERSPPPGPGREEKSAALARHAGNAVKKGEVVLCESWPCWSIVTDWHDDPSQLALSSPGHLAGRCKARPDSPMYILRPAERSLTRCEALREALRFGAAVAVGSFERDGFAYGGQLYDAWLAHLDREQFCPACGRNGWHCAERTASRVRTTQLSAMHFLRRAKAFMPSLCNGGCVDEAAAAYAEMAQKLAPYGEGSGLDKVWSNPRKRDRYTQDVRQVRDLHHSAAAHLSMVACVL